MAKKPLGLDGLLKGDAPQQESAPRQAPSTPVQKQPGEKRVTVALDGATYRRLRLYAANTDLTHQTILERALAQYLNNANA
ncbi:MAG: CopG family transcriptional regulator [Acidobacteriota bacterium]|nr:CopG family transcriptional regulator [Acidobacteriota bacterium]MDE2755699.1 CopG family transcriptional regulator [Acidobacteriota bacterium]